MMIVQWRYLVILLFFLHKCSFLPFKKFIANTKLNTYILATICRIPYLIESRLNEIFCEIYVFIFSYHHNNIICQTFKLTDTKYIGTC